MATVTIKLVDMEDTVNDDEEGMQVFFSFDPPPVTTDEEQSDMVTVSQDHGMFIVEQLLGYRLTDEDFHEPTLH